MIEHYGYNLITQYKGKMLELGNQIMNLENLQNVSAKEHFTKLGYNHTSIDINGLDGAMPLDLSKPIKEDLGLFDIITDMGTIEHVSNLYEALKNVFNLLNINGVVIHKNPKTGSFSDIYHKEAHHFTLDFWNEYAKETNMDIIKIEEHPIYHNVIDGWECIAILRKTKNSKQLTKAQFLRISKHIYNE